MVAGKKGPGAETNTAEKEKEDQGKEGKKTVPSVPPSKVVAGPPPTKKGGLSFDPDEE